MSIRIHPSIGVARLGNSPDGKLLVPNKTGGLPHEYNQDNLNQYDEINQNELPPVSFKDDFGRINRQGQPFRAYDDKGEILLDRGDIQSIEWTVHLANKKAEWYEYHELQGNLLYEKNSYEENGKRHYIDGIYPKRNRKIEGEDRRQLILDPGPRTVKVSISEDEIKKAYFTKNGHPFDPNEPDYLATGKFGNSIETLGEIELDSKGRLVVFGGHGNTCGDIDLAGYGGGDTWHDDISDGPITCKVTYTNHESNNEIDNVGKAWCIVGSPDFAPELVNISTLYDTMLDLGIHNFGTEHKGANGESILEGNVYNKDYNAIYERDIHPIFERMARYQWVGNVQPMVNFGLFTYDHKINVNELSNEEEKESILKHRKNVYNYFRQLDREIGKSAPIYPFNNGFEIEDTNSERYHRKSEYDSAKELENDKLMREKYSQENHPQEYLFKDQNDNFTTVKETPLNENVEKVEFGNIFPLMPLNAGSGAPRNENPLKFVALTKTQLFLLKQWSLGKCVSVPNYQPQDDPYYKDSISIGNCIGLPMSPGIEVTWSVHNPVIYESAFNIKHAELNNNSLTLTRDECEPTLDKENNIGEGCEPGDLTKRMACPWQADFLNCSVQTINFSNPAQNRHYIVDDEDYKNPKTDSPSINRSFPAPLYYAHWWPAQSPWEVLVGDFTSKRQIANGGFEAGRQMNYQRGINSYDQMVNYWDTLGFVRDINYKNEGFPYLVETERNHEFFTAKKLNVSNVIGIEGNDDVEIPIFYIEAEKAEEARKQQKVSPSEETKESMLMSDGHDILSDISENQENSYKEYKKTLIEKIKANSLRNLGSDSRRR